MTGIAPARDLVSLLVSLVVPPHTSMTMPDAIIAIVETRPPRWSHRCSPRIGSRHGVARRRAARWPVVPSFATMLLIALTAAGCRRDPGRDVKPMAAAPAGTAANATETIALENVSKSQPAVVGQRIANTDITITYSRPVARGRTLFGGIVPYNEVWNPGADQATAMTTTRDITVNGHRVAAGKYSLWMIPRSGTWTVIFSSAADVYHTPYPGEARDALRFDVAPQSGVHAETLTFDFPKVEGKDAELQFRWGTVIVPLAIVVP